MVRVRDRVSVRVRVTYSSNMKDVAKGLDSSSDLNLRVTVVTCPPSFLPAGTIKTVLPIQLAWLCPDVVYVVRRSICTHISIYTQQGR